MHPGKTSTCALRLAGVFLFALLPACAQYSAHQSGDVVQLEDTKHDTTVSIIPSVGDLVFEMKVKGQNVLHFPYSSIEEFKARPSLAGIPFLGPWANRLDEQAFYANGKKYPFNMTPGNVRGDHPIHGFLSFTDQWKVIEVKADRKAAWRSIASLPGWPSFRSRTRSK